MARSRDPSRTLRAAPLLVAAVAVALPPNAPQYLAESEQFTCTQSVPLAPGRWVASAFSLQPGLVGPGTQWPDGRVPIAYVKVGVGLGQYAPSDFNVSVLDDAGLAYGFPDAVLSWSRTTSVFAGPANAVTTLLASFASPFYSLTVRLDNIELRWVAIRMNDVPIAGPTPYACLVDNNVVVIPPSNPLVFENSLDFYSRDNDSTPWVEAPASTLGGLWFAIHAPDPTPSATSSARPTASTSASASASGTASASGSASGSASASATSSSSSTGSSTSSSSATATSTATLNVTAAGASAPRGPDVPLIAGVTTFCVVAALLGFAGLRWLSGRRSEPRSSAPRKGEGSSLSRRLESHRNAMKGLVFGAASADATALRAMASAYDEVYGVGITADPAAAALALKAAAAARAAANPVAPPRKPQAVAQAALAAPDDVVAPRLSKPKSSFGPTLSAVTRANPLAVAATAGDDGVLAATV